MYLHLKLVNYLQFLHGQVLGSGIGKKTENRLRIRTGNKMLPIPNITHYLDLPKIKGRGKGLATVVAEWLLREVKLEVLLEAACCVHSFPALLTRVGRLPRGQLVISTIQQPQNTYKGRDFVPDGKYSKRGWACIPPPPGQIFPSWWNVRQKAAVANLCVLCGNSSDSYESCQGPFQNYPNYWYIWLLTGNDPPRIKR